MRQRDISASLVAIATFALARIFAAPTNDQNNRNSQVFPEQFYKNFDYVVVVEPRLPVEGISVVTDSRKSPASDDNGWDFEFDTPVNDEDNFSFDATALNKGSGSTQPVEMEVKQENSVIDHQYMVEEDDTQPSAEALLNEVIKRQIDRVKNALEEIESYKLRHPSPTGQKHPGYIVKTLVVLQKINRETAIYLLLCQGLFHFALGVANSEKDLAEIVKNNEFWMKKADKLSATDGFCSIESQNRRKYRLTLT